MSTVNLSITSERLTQADTLLAGIPDGMNKALSDAAKRAGSRLRTYSSAAIREKYDISAKNIRDNENSKMRYSLGNGATVHVTFTGKKIPLIRYGMSAPQSPTPDRSLGRVLVPINGELRWAWPGVHARGHQFKGTPAAAQYHPTSDYPAFTATMRNPGDKNHTGIFARTGGVTASGSDEIQQIMGSSVAQMLSNEEVRENIAKDTAEKFSERFDQQVLALMNGWRS
ncbi:MAG: hypothetical protein LIO57_09000 [Oscillospiraceae bacterium]|nr:hypothetical protein [Oscillospiraceae bacterium]